MADDIDRAQSLTEALTADALKRHHAAVARQRVGLPHCENLDCREPITEARQRLGARLCDDCQREDDIRAGQYARGRG